MTKHTHTQKKHWIISKNTRKLYVQCVKPFFWSVFGPHITHKFFWLLTLLSQTFPLTTFLSTLSPAFCFSSFLKCVFSYGTVTAPPYRVQSHIAVWEYTWWPEHVWPQTLIVPLHWEHVKSYTLAILRHSTVYFPCCHKILEGGPLVQLHPGSIEVSLVFNDQINVILDTPCWSSVSRLCCHRGTSWKLPRATFYLIPWIIRSILLTGHAKHNPIIKTPFGIRHLNHLPDNGGAEKVCKEQQASQSSAAARSHTATKWKEWGTWGYTRTLDCPGRCGEWSRWRGVACQQRYAMDGADVASVFPHQLISPEGCTFSWTKVRWAPEPST